MPHDLQGGRHFKQAPSTIIWKCPACDGENAGPLEHGCMHCGSGQPGRKADPPTTVRTSTEVRTPSEVEAPVDVAFRAWRKDYQEDAGTSLSLHLYAAFVAGFYAAAGRVQQQTLEPLKGTPESRTIVAALKLFRDQILSDLPEESRSGEWLTPQEVDRLIERLERTDG